MGGSRELRIVVMTPAAEQLDGLSGYDMRLNYTVSFLTVWNTNSITNFKAKLFSMDNRNALCHVKDGLGSDVFTLVLTVNLEVSRVRCQCDAVMHKWSVLTFFRPVIDWLMDSCVDVSADSVLLDILRLAAVQELRNLWNLPFKNNNNSFNLWSRIIIIILNYDNVLQLHLR